MMRFAVLSLCLLAPVAASAASPSEVEAAFRRLWEHPALALNAGLNEPPPLDRPFVIRALEFTARTAKLQSLRWKPAPAPGGSYLRGELDAHLAGAVPPSTAPFDLTVVVPEVKLDRAALERRGAIELLEPGRFTAVSRIPIDLLATFNRGSKISVKDGTLEIRGRKRILLFDVPYRLTGPLTVPDRIHIVLVPTSLSLASIPAPRAIRQALVDSVNPVFCTDAAMGPLRHLATAELDGVDVEPRAIVIRASGRLRPPHDPEAGPPHHPPARPKR